MEAAQTWTEKFSVPDSDIAEWKKNLGQSPSLLHWCLLNGKVPESSYLDWASRHLNIPIVTSDFFTISPDHMFWSRVKDLHPWSSAYFPLSEWNGILFIGCVELPNDLQLKQPHQFVLASARNLQHLWSSLNPDAVIRNLKDRSLMEDQEATDSNHERIPLMRTASSSSPDIANKPDGLYTNALPSQGDSGSSTGTGLNFDLSFDSQDSPPPAPEGLALDPSETTPVHTQENSNVSSEFTSSAENSENSNPDFPVGLDPVSLGKISDELDFSGLEVETSSQNTAIAPVQDSSHSAHPPIPDISRNEPPPPPRDSAQGEDTLTTKSSQDRAEALRNPPPIANVTPPPLSMSTPPPVQAKKEGTSSLIEFTVTALAKMSSKTNQRVVSPKIETKPLDSCSNYDELGQQALVQVIQTFEHSIFFLFQSGELKPWKWTDRLPVMAVENPPTIDLSSPSIFRIVYRTRLPYHGYVVASQVNNDFFNVFHGGMIPKHVTLVPILVENQIGGMVMGISNSDIGYKMSLRTMELLADEVSRNFARLRKHRSAA